MAAPQYNARIFELRRLGFQIQNKIREIGGKRLSWFRILSAPAVGSDARPKERTKDVGSGAAIEDPSLFGSLAPQRRYPD